MPSIPYKPYKPLRCSVFLSLNFVDDEGLESSRLRRGSELSFTDFLKIRNTQQKLSKRLTGSMPCTFTLPSMSFLTGVKATEPNTSGAPADQSLSLNTV